VTRNAVSRWAGSRVRDMNDPSTSSGIVTVNLADIRESGYSTKVRGAGSWGSAN
jgi:hypothetical protein